MFPGLQGGPHNHTTAAKAVAFGEAATPAFSAYAHQIVANAKALAEQLLARGYGLVTGRHRQPPHARRSRPTRASRAAWPRRRSTACGIELNGNSIPFDPAQAVRSVRHPHRRRPRSPRAACEASTWREVATLIDDGIREAAAAGGDVEEAFGRALKARVREFLAPFDAPGIGAG